MNLKGWMAALLAAAACCGCTPAAKSVQLEERDTLVQTDAATLADGTALDLWHSGYIHPETGETEENDTAIYKLKDGTALLWVDPTRGPEHSYVGGQESFDDLSETAQAAVRAYYEERGDLYDLQAELERAYGIYRECLDTGEAFFPGLLEQDTSPTASNGRLMCFLTTVHYPTGPGSYDELRFGEVFDRETGEKIDNLDLFCLPEKEVLQRILDNENLDKAIRTEMENAVNPEHIALFPEDLQIYFPTHSLPSAENGWYVTSDYRSLDGVIYEWAVPEKK